MAEPSARVLDLGFRFTPSPLQAAAYYLPRLIAGAPLHDALRPVIHCTDIYACEPGVLAGRFRPAPKTDDRFFFTPVKLQPKKAGKASRAVRAAGPGTWSSQKAIDILDGAGAKVGELTKLRYKKRGENTDWLMEEYSCCSEEAVAGDTQFVLCKIYVSPRAAQDSAAHQESAAVFAQPAPPEAPVVITQAATKRPSPPVAELPCPKKMRVAVAPSPAVAPAGCTTPVAPPRPGVLPPRRVMAPSSTPSVTRSPAPSMSQAAPVHTRPVVQPDGTSTTAFAPPRSCAPPQKQVPLPPPSVPQQAAARYRPPRPAVLTPPAAQAPLMPRPAPAAASLPVPVAPPALPSTEAPAADDDDMFDFAKELEDAMTTGEAGEEEKDVSHGDSMMITQADVHEQVHKERDPFAAAMALGEVHKKASHSYMYCQVR
ncbi:hypothetical protein ACP70R_020393 [Stipagrostis hirtigluma subsp. patula]